MTVTDQPRRRRDATTARSAGRGRRALAAAALCLAVLLVPVTAGAATPAPTPSIDRTTPGPTPSADESAVPDDVREWFASEGTEAARDASTELVAGDVDAADLEVGPPRQVSIWAPDFVAGIDSERASTPSKQWVAAIVHLTEDSHAPVGAVHGGPLDSGEPQVHQVVTDAELGAALMAEDDARAVVYDDTIDGWFAAADGEVWPLTTEARSVLHGAVPLAVFQPFLIERIGSPPPEPLPEDEPAEDTSLVPLAVIVVIVLLGAVAAWLLVRAYRRADSRIEADVRAGLTPLEGIPRPEVAVPHTTSADAAPADVAPADGEAPAEETAGPALPPRDS